VKTGSGSRTAITAIAPYAIAYNGINNLGLGKRPCANYKKSKYALPYPGNELWSNIHFHKPSIEQINIFDNTR
jgi:hypothetical protein